MDFSMAVQAGTAIHPVVRRRPPEGIETRVECPGMTCYIMAALAKLWHPVRQEFSLIAAVDRMTSLAVLLHRGMLPEKWPPFFGMALVTKFIDRSGLDKLLSETAVMVMTIRTFDLAFPKGVMGLLCNLAPYIPVTGKTEIGLGCFQIHSLTGMNRMAVVARNACRFVRSHIPLGKASHFAMTVEAFSGFGRPIELTGRRNLGSAVDQHLGVGGHRRKDADFLV